MSSWLLVVEGPSEFRDARREGFMQALLSQLADANDRQLAAALECDGWEPVALPDLRVRTVAQLAQVIKLPPPQPRGMARVSARAVRAARVLQCEALVVLIDNDRERAERGCRRRNELRSGVAECDLAHAVGVAKEMLEAWIIADPEVLPARIEISRAPEDIWGDPRDPNCEHPKCVLKRALDEAGVQYCSVLENWSVRRAAEQAPWLRTFCSEIVILLSNRALCRPKAWDQPD